MTTETWSHEIESPVSAGRLFKASMLDWHNLGPKVLPEIIASGAPVSGDKAAAGSVRQLNFTSAMPFPYIKERLDFIDHGKLECKSSLVEGGLLGTKLESASFHFKFEPSGKGCVAKVTSTYKALPGVDVSGDTVEAKESVTGLIKAAEAHLLANPTAYA